MKAKLIAYACFLIVSMNALHAQETINEEYKKVVKEMFDVSGMEQIYTTMINGLFDMYKKQNKDISVEIWDEFKKEFQISAMNDLGDLLTPVYYNHLTIDDLKAAIDFYKSSAGKKFVEKTPIIMQEAMIVGEKWGNDISKRFIKKLEEKGY